MLIHTFIDLHINRTFARVPMLSYAMPIIVLGIILPYMLRHMVDHLGEVQLSFSTLQLYVNSLILSCVVPQMEDISFKF